ncbi:unnamed protein product [Lymnaea stagnalis]|uniref:Solute carrier family 35 member F6 n=1 Tax=Lymnaea stagnalis TaxID=6523 RepID=A0AAV2HT46_LYMST
MPNIITGIAFVFVGLILVLCDRWPQSLSVPGKPTRKPHLFDHLILLWFCKQILQLLLLPLWYLIERNILGFGHFRHGEVQQRGRQNRPVPLLDINDMPDAQGEQNANCNEGLINEGLVNDNDRQPLIEPVRRPNRPKKPSLLVYFPAAFFAQASVLLLYFGMKLTYPSSFIMLKGTVAFFTALLAMAFLAQQLACYVWFGVIVATLGFAVSGISDYIHVPSGGYEKYGIAAGDLLIVMSQIMFATKIIYEEKFIRKHSIHPMLFLGAEAVYGVFFAGLFFALFNLLDLVQYSYLPNGRMEDVEDALYQLHNSWECSLAFSGSLIFYLLYTYLGMFLIRDQGALPRIMIETLIWAFFWGISLALKWEDFFIGQVPGLCVIPIGVLIYSHILVIPFGSCGDRVDPNAQDPFFPPDNGNNAQAPAGDQPEEIIGCNTYADHDGNGTDYPDVRMVLDGAEVPPQQDDGDVRLLGNHVLVQAEQLRQRQAVSGEN